MSGGSAKAADPGISPDARPTSDDGVGPLALDDVPSFLLELGVLDTAAIVEGEPTAFRVARRNTNYRVERPDGSGWFIKQPGDPALGGFETLAREAELNLFFRDLPAAEGLLGVLPRLVHWRNPGTLLVFDLIADAVPMESFLEDPANERAGEEVSRRLGSSLGTFHRTFDRFDATGTRLEGKLLRTAPWGLELHRPNIAELAHIGPGVHEALRIVQEPGGCGPHLDRLRREWRDSTLIHGDIRFDNVLVRKPRAGGPASVPGPWIVDWEMVQHGDPAWDLAGALQDFLVLWVSSMPPGRDLTAEERVAGARRPLASLRPAIAALWAGYREGAELNPAEASPFLRRTVEFSAARLLQSAFERADGRDRLPGQSVMLLQLAANLLTDPGRGQHQLYGLDAGRRQP